MWFRETYNDKKNNSMLPFVPVSILGVDHHMSEKHSSTSGCGLGPARCCSPLFINWWFCWPFEWNVLGEHLEMFGLRVAVTESFISFGVCGGSPPGPEGLTFVVRVRCRFGGSNLCWVGLFFFAFEFSSWWTENEARYLSTFLWNGYRAISPFEICKHNLTRMVRLGEGIVFFNNFLFIWAHMKRGRSATSSEERSGVELHAV